MINSTNNNSAFKPTFCSNFENLVEMANQRPAVQKAIRIAEKDISHFIGDDLVHFTLKDDKRCVGDLEIKGFLMTCKILKAPKTGIEKIKNYFFKYLASFTHGNQIMKQKAPEEIVMQNFILSSTQSADFINSANKQYIEGFKKIYKY